MSPSSLPPLPQAGEQRLREGPAPSVGQRPPAVREPGWLHPLVLPSRSLEVRKGAPHLRRPLEGGPPLARRQDCLPEPPPDPCPRPPRSWTAGSWRPPAAPCPGVPGRAAQVRGRRGRTVGADGGSVTSPGCRRRPALLTAGAGRVESPQTPAGPPPGRRPTQLGQVAPGGPGRCRAGCGCPSLRHGLEGALLRPI